MTDFRKPLEKLVGKKKAEIADLEAKLNTARIELGAYEESLKAVSRQMPTSKPASNGSARASGLQPDSLMGRVYSYLREQDGPKHVKDILEALGRDTDARSIRNASTQLNYYVGLGRYFTRPESSTYGLIEAEAQLTRAVVSVGGGDQG